MVSAQTLSTLAAKWKEQQLQLSISIYWLCSASLLLCAQNCNTQCSYAYDSKKMYILIASTGRAQLVYTAVLKKKIQVYLSLAFGDDMV